MAVIILVGALGGIAPTLLKLAIDLTQQNTTINNLNASLFLGMTLFGVLGGIVAGIWGERNLKKVFYLGLGLPSLLSVATSDATTRNSTPPAASASKSAMLSIPRVFAATDPVPGRTLKVILPSGIPSDQAQVAFATESGEQLEPIGETPIPIPPSAQSIRIRGALGTSNPVSLPAVPGALLTLSVGADKNTWYGFQYAIGVHSDPFTLTAKFKPLGNLIAVFHLKDPVALAYAPPQNVLALQQDGAIFIQNQNAFVPFAKVPDGYSAIDLAATTINGVTHAVVVGANSLHVPFLLMQAPNTANVLVTSALGTQLTGVAADSTTQTLYAGKAPDPQVEAWTIAATGLTGRHLVARVPDAAGLGAVAVDAGSRNLFVADPKDQIVYRISIGRRAEVMKFLEARQSINTLAVDSVKRTLFVGGGDKVIAVSTDTPGAPRKIATTLKSISGLCVDGDHMLWVSGEGGEVDKLNP